MVLGTFRPPRPRNHPRPRPAQPEGLPDMVKSTMHGTRRGGVSFSQGGTRTGPPRGNGYGGLSGGGLSIGAGSGGTNFAGRSPGQGPGVNLGNLRHDTVGVNGGGGTNFAGRSPGQGPLSFAQGGAVPFGGQPVPRPNSGLNDRLFRALDSVDRILEYGRKKHGLYDTAQAEGTLQPPEDVDTTAGQDYSTTPYTPNNESQVAKDDTSEDDEDFS